MSLKEWAIKEDWVEITPDLGKNMMVINLGKDLIYLSLDKKYTNVALHASGFVYTQAPTFYCKSAGNSRIKVTSGFMMVGDNYHEDNVGGGADASDIGEADIKKWIDEIVTEKDFTTQQDVATYIGEWAEKNKEKLIDEAKIKDIAKAVFDEIYQSLTPPEGDEDNTTPVIYEEQITQIIETVLSTNSYTNEQQVKEIVADALKDFTPPESGETKPDIDKDKLIDEVTKAVTSSIESNLNTIVSELNEKVQQQNTRIDEIVSTYNEKISKLENDIAELEAGSGDGATIAQVKNEIETALKEANYINEQKVSELIDERNYLTEEEIDKKISGIEIPEVPEVDLSNLATKKELENKVDKVELANLATKVELETKADKSEVENLKEAKADKTELESLATKDEIKSLVSVTDLNTKLDEKLETFTPEIDLSGVVSKTKDEEISGKLSLEKLPTIKEPDKDDNLPKNPGDLVTRRYLELMGAIAIKKDGSVIWSEAEYIAEPNKSKNVLYPVEAGALKDNLEEATGLNFETRRALEILGRIAVKKDGKILWTESEFLAEPNKNPDVLYPVEANEDKTGGEAPNIIKSPSGSYVWDVTDYQAYKEKGKLEPGFYFCKQRLS